jgi:hypothetical protein
VDPVTKAEILHDATNIINEQFALQLRSITLVVMNSSMEIVRLQITAGFTRKLVSYNDKGAQKTCSLLISRLFPPTRHPSKTARRCTDAGADEERQPAKTPILIT